MAAQLENLAGKDFRRTQEAVHMAVGMSLFGDGSLVYGARRSDKIIGPSPSDIAYLNSLDSQIIEREPEISLAGRAWNNFKHVVGSALETKPAKVVLRYAVPATPLIAAATMVACGGGSAEGQTSNNNGGAKIEPAATATKPPEPSPTITPTVAPTTRPTEVPKAQIPAQADKFLNDLKSIASMNDAQRVDIRGNFESDWARADTERKKWFAYITVYSQLRAIHNVTKDPVLKAKMAEIELYLKNTWPDFYQATLNDPNAWLR